jgi:hypothetical protein
MPSGNAPPGRELASDFPRISAGEIDMATARVFRSGNSQPCGCRKNIG